MALVVLTVLLDRGIITGNTFSALTLVAVITTLLAMPLARLGLRLSDRQRARCGALATRTDDDQRFSPRTLLFPPLSGVSRCPKTTASIRAGLR